MCVSLAQNLKVVYYIESEEKTLGFGSKFTFQPVPVSSGSNLKHHNFNNNKHVIG